jgi:hypothetical protein
MRDSVKFWHTVQHGQFKVQSMAQLWQWIRSDFCVPVGIDDIRFVPTLLDIHEQLPVWTAQAESSRPSSIGNLVSTMHSKAKSGSVYD